MEKNKRIDFEEGKMILLYGGNSQNTEKMLDVLFQSSSKNWSKDYAKLTTSLKTIKLWKKRMEKVNFLTIHMFLMYYKFFQKELYKENDEKILKTLHLDSNKKLKNLTEEEKERLLFFLLYVLDLQVYVFTDFFSKQSYQGMKSMVQLLKEAQKEKKSIFLVANHQWDYIEALVSDVIVVGKKKIVKYEPVEKICHYNYSIVRLKGKEYKKLRLSIKNIILKEQTDDEIVFLYCGKFHELFEVLETVELEDVEIRKQSLEEALHALKV